MHNVRYQSYADIVVLMQSLFNRPFPNVSLRPRDSVNTAHMISSGELTHFFFSFFYTFSWTGLVLKWLTRTHQYPVLMGPSG